MTQSDEPREGVIYRVVCHDCDGEIIAERDPQEPPEWHPEPTTWSQGAALSGAKGKRDKHRRSTSVAPEPGTHDVEIKEIDRDDV